MYAFTANDDTDQRQTDIYFVWRLGPNYSILVVVVACHCEDVCNTECVGINKCKIKESE